MKALLWALLVVSIHMAHAQSAPQHTASVPLPSATPSVDPVAAYSNAEEVRAAWVRAEGIRRVLKHEGGYAELGDGGGATHYGITTPTARRHGYKGPMSGLSRERAIQMYEAMWAQGKMQDVKDAEMAMQLFDAYVNHGPRALKWLPTVGGRVGCERLNARRMNAYRNSRGWDRFQRGWKKRINKQLAYCKSLSR